MLLLRAPGQGEGEEYGSVVLSMNAISKTYIIYLIRKAARKGRKKAMACF